MKQREGVRGGGDKGQTRETEEEAWSKSKYLLPFYQEENLLCFTSAARYGKIEPSNFTVCLLPTCCYTRNKVGLVFPGYTGLKSSYIIGDGVWAV